MSTSAALSAWAARTAGLASTSGRHAAHFVPVQQQAGAARRRRCHQGGVPPRAQALSFDGRPAGSAMGQRQYSTPLPSSFGARPPPGLAALQQQQRPAPSQLGEQQQAAGPPPHGALAQQQPAGGNAASSQQLPPDEHELRRRQKISAANKGRVPWNKGRKHPPEVIARIRAATQKAMQRPDVKERLAKANEKREPHSDEAKAKIRVKLQERANAAREEINQQADLILRDRLAASDNPEWRQLAEYPKAHTVVSGLAWQYFKKDWDTVATRGWDEHPEFRERCINKLRRMAERATTASQPKKRKVDKVKAALSHMKKLEEAQAKLGAAEEAVEKLRRAKIAFAGDPARLAAATAAEEKASQLLSKLRQQVTKLEKALEPLQEYLEAASAESGAATGQHPLDLEQRLQAAQAAQQDRAQQLLGGAGEGPAGMALNGASSSGAGSSNGMNGYAPVAAAGGYANGASPSVGSSNDAVAGMPVLNGAGAGHPAAAAASQAGAGRGTAAVPMPAAPAVPGRSALPWQR